MKILKIFDSFFGKKKKEQNIEVKNLSNSTVNVLQTEVVNITSLFSNNPYNDLVIENPYSYNSSLASLTKNISYRTETIEEISLQWNDKTWLNIYGGYDTGKSQLSLLIAKHLDCDYFSFSFKDLSENEFKNIIVLVCAQILSNNLDKAKKLVIFDDLPQLGFDDNINKLFVQLLNYCNANGINIVSTSNHKIHHKITEIIKDNFVELQVPLLSEDEIKEIISTYKNEESSKKFSTIIEVISSGYPIYVQIICKYLEDKNWILSDDELTKFFSGKAFDGLDDETYQKLLHTTHSEATREILYRANLILGTISNETIEIVSNVDPAVTTPFEKINSLSGTWLQKNNDETYFISPLIKRLGSNNILNETRKEINNKLAHHVLSKKNLSQYDSQRAITYFIAGESYNDAGMVMAMTLQTYFKHPEIFTDTIFGAFWINTELPEQMISVTKITIRVLQLHILDDLQIRKHTKFHIEDKNYVRADLEKLFNDTTNTPQEITNLINLILFKSYIPDDIEKALNYYNILNDLGFDKFNESENSLYNNLWLVLDKIYTIDEIKKWFETFDKIGKTEDFYDKEMIHLFSRRLIDNIIEVNKDWNDTIEILNFIEKKSQTTKLELLQAYSVKNKISILSEKLNNLSEAEAYYEKIKDLFKNPEAVFLIKDELGRQQFYKGNKEKSLLNLLDVEDINISIVTKLDTYLTIAKIFGENDNRIAHTYTKKALDYSQNNIKTTKLTKVKLIGEYAISLWLLGDFKQALYQLSESYELLLSAYKEIDTFENIDDFNITVLRIGNTLNYIYQIVAFGKPPTKTYNDSDYAIPVRDVFNSTYDAKLLNEWYYEERKYLNVYTFIQTFEFFNDQENAIKWANYAFELNNEIELYTFKNTLRSFVVYKILQSKHQETIEIEEDLKKYENSLDVKMADEIKNGQQKQMFLELLTKKPTSNDTDDYYLTYNLIPIVFRELTLFLENKNTIDKVISNIKEHLLKSDSLYTDKKTLEAIYYILDNFPTNYNNYNKLLKWVNNVGTENLKPIQIICYAICSLQANTKDALSLHLAFMPYLEKVLKGLSKGTHLFILYPFVYKFWTSRILTNPQDFYLLELWQKNLSKSISIKNDYKVVAIYCLISMHLSQRPDKQTQEWMQPYIDFMIRTK